MGLFEFLFPPTTRSNTAALKRIADKQKWATALNKSKVKGVDDRIGELENDLMVLTLAFASLLETVNEKGVVTRAEVQEKMSELDILDGFKDGRLPVSLLRNWTNASK